MQLPIAATMYIVAATMYIERVTEAYGGGHVAAAIDADTAGANDNPHNGVEAATCEI
jgi:hypothetical protein